MSSTKAARVLHRDTSRYTENFDRAFRATLTLPKAAVLKEEAKKAGAGKEAA